MVLVFLRPMIVLFLISLIVYFGYRKLKKVNASESLNEKVENATNEVNATIEAAKNIPSVDKKELKKAEEKLKKFTENN